ncbi:redoxin domain-containing protein [Puniceicoccaceae bacterium K14]|nr:redoxin domain-containing protein [Puniceicoccaceae bacterium K14]
MPSLKLDSGGIFPHISLPLVGGGETKLGQSDDPKNWRLVFIYRGLHCPVCHKYLKKLDSMKDKFLDAKAEIIVVSADPTERAEAMVNEEDLSLQVCYGLSIEQMQSLGLWLSKPRPTDDVDHVFPEPALFAINTDRKIQLIDQSNTPFNRADLDELLDTIIWIQENNYPTRGTYGQKGSTV